MSAWETIREAARRHVAPLLDPPGPRRLPDAPPAALAFLAWALRDAAQRPVLCLVDGPRTMETLLRDLRTLAPADVPPALAFPSWEAWPGGSPPPEPAVVGTRLATLATLAAPGAPPPVVAACLQALLEPTLAPDALRAGTLRLGAGEAFDPARLMEHLVAFGYHVEPEVQAPAEAAVRGGLIDVWPLAEPWPFRLEFLGATLESLRTFDPADQRSRDRREAVCLPPAREWGLPGIAARETLLDALGGAPWIALWADPRSILDHAALFAAAAREAGAAMVRPLDVTLARLRAATPHHVMLGSACPGDEAAPEADPGLGPLPLAVAADRDRRALPPDLIEQSRGRLLDDLAGRHAAGETVALRFDTAGGLARFHELYPAGHPAAALPTAVGPLSGGFTCPALGLHVAGEADLYGRRLRRRKSPLEPGGAAARPAGARIRDWTDMEPGQRVVHIEHGVGRYLGLQEIELNGVRQEVLVVEYADAAKLYVPVSQAHLLTRYVGLGGRPADLHTLGGKRWARDKDAASQAVQDLAASLLLTQAARATRPGFAFPPDGAWQHELEGGFPYETTADQEQAIHDVKADMEAARPMDRLLCGDAGYGKTEVAVRAAFKTVMAGKQVAVLVPTTVLAQQHYQTFRDRVGAFPVALGMLSRFNSGSEHRRVLAGLRDGTVDVVIGTHALIQPGVEFRDLGLLIVDEEQRFGVAHKERFKERHPLVDVLTLTATPIPRTLYLSLTGARDLSTIQTPPQERLGVETRVVPATDTVVREAILRELAREGQVYYLHNRVGTIDRVALRLRTLVPEARLEIAHGQMATGQLAEIVQAFAQGEFDVLVCTTIIESGLDIPNANTIVIDRADRFGLADLYQLRGRVGRSRHQAYAYLMLPAHAPSDPTVRKRMQAIRDYSGAGAGFRLAMRDLELRGAGNMLGAAQSGHIVAVGFGLYCQLLRRAVAQAKGEPPPPLIDVEVRIAGLGLSAGEADKAAACVPSSYVAEERLRVSVYRRIAEAAYVREVRELAAELRDRFGPPPLEVVRLLRLAEIRILAAGHGITAVDVEGGKLMLRRGEAYVQNAGRFPRLRAQAPDAVLDEVLRHLRRREL